MKLVTMNTNNTIIRSQTYNKFTKWFRYSMTTLVQFFQLFFVYCNRYCSLCTRSNLFHHINKVGIQQFHIYGVGDILLYCAITIFIQFLMSVIVWSKGLSTLNFYTENLGFLELSLKMTAKVWNPKRSTRLDEINQYVVCY